VVFKYFLRFEDIIVDCLVRTIATDNNAGTVTLEAINKVKAKLRDNQTPGASNVSYCLPERGVPNGAFLYLEIAVAVTCPTINVTRMHQAVLVTDLILNRNRYAQRYIKAYWQRQKL